MLIMNVHNIYIHHYIRQCKQMYSERILVACGHQSVTSHNKCEIRNKMTTEISLEVCMI